MFSWKGTWRNQYGSVVIIDDDSEGLIRGVCKTALPDSSFSGMEVPLHGAGHGDVIGFTSAASGKTGPAAVSYTGIFRDGKIEMLWHTVAGLALSAEAEGEPAKLTTVGTWRAFGTSLDTFERVD